MSFEETKNKHVHYLKVLRKDSSIMQPEIRDAIHFAISMLSNIKEK